MTNLTLGISYDIRDAKKAQNYSDPNPTLILDKRGNHKKNKKGSYLYSYNDYLWEFTKDKNKVFNYQALLKHSFDGFDELTLSFAKKSRFANIKDRYSRRFGKSDPNPYLKEENAYHYEIGYNRNFLDSLNLGVAVFYSDVKDKIQEVYIDKFNNQRKRFYQFQNVGDVDFYGAELNTTWFATNSLEIGANYTYINSDDGTDMDGHTVYMTDIPKHNFLHI